MAEFLDVGRCGRSMASRLAPFHWRRWVRAPVDPSRCWIPALGTDDPPIWRRTSTRRALWGHGVLAAHRELASRDLRLREKHLGFGCVEQPKGGFTGGWGESGDGGRYDGTACGATHLASGEHDSSMVSSARI
jgi:hypothetical protein